jgi:hypothetical protein
MFKVEYRERAHFSKRSPAHILLSIIFILLVIGCSLRPVNETASPPPLSFTPIPTFTRTPEIAVQFIPCATPLETDTAFKFLPFPAAITADNVNLRTHAGTLFPVSRLLARGTHVMVHGHAPGGEWLYVQLDSDIYGWVLFWLVDEGKANGVTPLIHPNEQATQLVTGYVVDRAGVPISGIGFAVTQRAGFKELRSDATTDSTGHFYAYLPATLSGQWYVTYVSVSCNSNTMDAGCNCIGGACGKVEPEGITIALPYSGALEFLWK